jgi:acyl carrier protein
MGLDSVELVMEVEKYFGIAIPDPEAEKAYTIQAMVDIVARHLNLTGNGMELRDKIFEKVNQALLKLGLINTPVSLADLISKYLFPDNKETWQAFKNELQLKVPKPDTIKRNSPKLIDKIKFAINWTPMYDWSSITVDQFVAAICANNYEELIDKEHIKSTYEIYIAVTAITVDKIGVDYYEIAPEKSFTTDLGVD